MDGKAFDPEARKARLAAARAERPAFGPEIDGTIADLRPGDFVISVGAAANIERDAMFARAYRRYRVERTVETVEAGLNGITVRWFGLDPLVGIRSYPVRYRRPETTR